MANKVQRVVDTNDEIQGYSFHCKGCGCSHMYYTVSQHRGAPVWTFNGDMEKPTFKASLMVNRDLGNPSTPRCHIFVTDGKIQYLNDCTHKLAGQTIEMDDCD